MSSRSVSKKKYEKEKEKEEEPATERLKQAEDATPPHSAGDNQENRR